MVSVVFYYKRMQVVFAMPTIAAVEHGMRTDTEPCHQDQ
ncbi:hypothetical protein RKLH11_3338 [Rhodobacteraceae bacterium KLH11]|nr:hypothetical protein RKLH11_3338 [Rhodobacteraceae bacterium KLH11]